MTPFGLVKQTSLPRDVVERAVERLKEAGLLEVLADDERGYESWRINEASLAAVTIGDFGGWRHSRGACGAGVILLMCQCVVDAGVDTGAV